MTDAFKKSQLKLIANAGFGAKPLRSAPEKRERPSVRYLARLALSERRARFASALPTAAVTPLDSGDSQ